MADDKTGDFKKPSSSGQVLLHAVQPDDLLVFFKHQIDVDAVRMAEFPSRNQPAFMAHWGKILADDRIVAQTIEYNGQAAGNIVSFPLNGKREVGYWIGKEFWGRGIATAALAEFLQLLSERPLYAEVAIHNRGSQRVLEKCGFIRLAVDQAASEAGVQTVAFFVYVLR